MFFFIYLFNLPSSNGLRSTLSCKQGSDEPRNAASKSQSDNKDKYVSLPSSSRAR